MLQQRLASHPEDRAWTAEGTAVFVDVSGFTKLSEKLARKGREGSEQIAEAIGGSFEAILFVAYENGASLLKFGGDSLLLWFEGERPRRARLPRLRAHARALRNVGTHHAARCQDHAAHDARRAQRHVPFLRRGTSHLELLPVGPAWTTVVTMEHAADAGEIVVSAQTAAALPASCLGAEREGGRLLVRDPAPRDAGDAAHAAAADSRRAACPLPAGRGSRARAARRRYARASARHDRLPADRRHRHVYRAARRGRPRPRRSIAWSASSRPPPRNRASRCLPPTSTRTPAS